MSERCFLVLAPAGDPAIQPLRQLLPRQLVHAKIADLSSSGWRYVVGRPELATAAADGRVIRAEQIAAVWCRLSSITPEDLTHLHADDREFVAGEMHAFLRAWLSQFGGRACNQPNSTSLAGPAWLPMRWRWLATHSGIPAVAAASAAEQGDAVTALVAGHQVLGTRDASVIRHALSLAGAVHSTLLAVNFVKQGEWRFASADPNPQLDAAGAAALLEWAFESQPQCAAVGA
jgi:hypothetical protein